MSIWLVLIFHPDISYLSYKAAFLQQCLARQHFSSPYAQTSFLHMIMVMMVCLIPRWRPERMKSRALSWQRSWSCCWLLDTSEQESKDCRLLIR